jgi:hypothetical protein
MRQDQATDPLWLIALLRAQGATAAPPEVYRVLSDELEKTDIAIWLVLTARKRPIEVSGLR